MSVREGNKFYSLGHYEQAIEAYEKVEASSPMYQHALINIGRASKFIASQTLISSEKIIKGHKTSKIKLTLKKALSVKGIPAGDCLTCTLDELSSNHYYRVTISTDSNISAVISVRDSNRNLPLYQSSSADIRTGDHIFFIPPSVKSNVSISLHLTDNTQHLENLGETVLITTECLGHIDEVSFKPGSLIKPVIASMATIESRLDIAIDAAYSLLSQVDRIHIHINDASVIPKSLQHDKIIVSLESSHGNLGDSAKFLGAQVEDDAYVLVCDDDFIFPYDFILQSYLTLALENFHVIVGMHGIFLRYPLEDYYANDARNTMHITTGFSFSTTVSAVGTGAIFFDSLLFPTKSFVLDYKNMADIWFALECNRLNLPILIQKRRTNWIIDNPPSEQASAIWKHSVSNVVSEANTRDMQTYVLSGGHGYLSALPLTGKIANKDYILVVDFEIFKKFAHIIEKISKITYSPSVILVQGCTDAALAKKIGRSIYADIVLSSDQHCASNLQDKFLAHSFKFILQLSSSLEFSENSLKILIDLFRNAYKNVPTQLDIPIFFDALALQGLVRYIPNKSSNPQWTVKADSFVVAPLVEGVLKIFNQAHLPQAETLLNLHIPSLPIRQPSYPAIKIAKYFDKIYLLNLDRRPDRLEEFKKRASKLGIVFDRISAVDGSLDEISLQYTETQSRLKKIYGSLGHQFKYESSSYWEYRSEGERVSHLLQKNGKTYSAGGYGYLRTYKTIIEDAIANRYNRIAVFDDDCLFHKNMDELFDGLIRSIPNDWVTISLGSLQYEWRNKHIGLWSYNAYRCGGHSVGSHAQAYSKTAFPMLLEYINRYTLPFDVGPLHYLKRYYSTKSFTALPNLFIQDVADTDIGDSSVQLSEGSKKNNVYKWNLSDYE